MTFEELSKTSINETFSDMAKDIAGKLGVKLDSIANNSKAPKPNTAEIGSKVDLDVVRKNIFNKQNVLRLKNRLSSFDTEDSSASKLESKCVEKVNQMKENYKSVKGKLSKEQINSWHTSSKDLGNFFLEIYPKGSEKAIVAGNENLGFAKFESDDKRNNSDFLANYIEKMWENSKSHKDAILLTIPSGHRGSKFKVVSAMAITAENGTYFFAQVMACVVVNENQKEQEKITSSSLGKEYGFTTSQVKKMFNILFNKNIDEEYSTSRIITLNGRKLYEADDWADVLESDKNDEISVFKKFLEEVSKRQFQQKIVSILDDPESLKNTFRTWAAKQNTFTTHETKAIRKMYPNSSPTPSDKRENKPEEKELTDLQWEEKILSLLTKINLSDELLKENSSQLVNYVYEYMRDCQKRNAIIPKEFLVMIATTVSDIKEKESVVSNIQSTFIKLEKADKTRSTVIKSLLGLQSAVMSDMRSFCKEVGGSRMIVSTLVKYVEIVVNKKDVLPKVLFNMLKDFVYSEPDKLD